MTLYAKGDNMRMDMEVTTLGQTSKSQIYSVGGKVSFCVTVANAAQCFAPPTDFKLPISTNRAETLPLGSVVTGIGTMRFIGREVEAFKYDFKTDVGNAPLQNSGTIYMDKQTNLMLFLESKIVNKDGEIKTILEASSVELGPLNDSIFLVPAGAARP